MPRLTLSQAVDLALKGNPNLGAASARSSEAAADYAIAAARLLPKVTANASVNLLGKDRIKRPGNFRLLESGAFAKAPKPNLQRNTS
ncbi:MAG: TolC family protein [Thiobacillus sp.]